MPTKTLSQRFVVSDEPEPGFMISVREWNSYCERVKHLADPLENPYGWAQVFCGIAVGMIFATVALPDKDEHPIQFAIHLAAAIAFTLATAYTASLGKRQQTRRKESSSAIVQDMEHHRDAKAPHAAGGNRGTATD